MEESREGEGRVVDTYVSRDRLIKRRKEKEKRLEGEKRDEGGI